jgi:uncharacterized protein YqjF (DUF2071 family)
MVCDIENHLLQDASLWTDIELEASRSKHIMVLSSVHDEVIWIFSSIFSNVGFCSSRIPVEVWLLLFLCLNLSMVKLFSVKD